MRNDSDGKMSAEQVWMTVRFGETLQELRAGLEATRHLFGDLLMLCRQVREAGPPAAIVDLIIVVEDAAAEVLSAMATPGGVLGVDRALRRDRRSRIEGALRALAELDALQSLAVLLAQVGMGFPVNGD
jgi:hypothetical protein